MDAPHDEQQEQQEQQHGQPTYDGNVLAGPLSEVFTVEMTTAVTHCGGCGLASTLATLRVYAPETGLVARCPGCGGVSVRVVRTQGATWLDLSGVSAVQIPRDDRP